MMELRSSKEKMLSQLEKKWSVKHKKIIKQNTLPPFKAETNTRVFRSMLNQARLPNGITFDNGAKDALQAAVESEIVYMCASAVEDNPTNKHIFKTHIKNVVKKEVDVLIQTLKIPLEDDNALEKELKSNQHVRLAELYEQNQM